MKLRTQIFDHSSKSEFKLSEKLIRVFQKFLKKIKLLEEKNSKDRFFIIFFRAFFSKKLTQIL